MVPGTETSGDALRHGGVLHCPGVGVILHRQANEGRFLPTAAWMPPPGDEPPASLPSRPGPAERRRWPWPLPMLPRPCFARRGRCGGEPRRRPLAPAEDGRQGPGRSPPHPATRQDGERPVSAVAPPGAVSPLV